jgi:uncharacterized membrane protein (Fun14 family)
MKIVTVVVGLFVAGIAYLSYRGWIDVKWMEIENATRTTLNVRLVLDYISFSDDIPAVSRPKTLAILAAS